MRLYDEKIFSKKFNIFILTIFVVFFCLFSILVNLIALSDKNEHYQSSSGVEFNSKDNFSTGENFVCINGFLFNLVNGKKTKVFEREDDPVYLANGERVLTGRIQARCQ